MPSVGSWPGEPREPAHAAAGAPADPDAAGDGAHGGGEAPAPEEAPAEARSERPGDAEGERTSGRLRVRRRARFRSRPIDVRHAKILRAPGFVSAYDLGMRRALQDALGTLERMDGLIGAGLVDRNGFLVHAVGGHAGHDPEAIAVHLPRSERSDLERALDMNFDEDLHGSADGAVLLRRVAGGDFVAYAWVGPVDGLGPVRFALKGFARTIEDALEAPARRSASAQRERLEDVREFRGGAGLGKSLDQRP